MSRFYELFAGIGLVREALEPLGWECVYANDFDPKKRAIYRARFPGEASADLDGRDLFDVDPAELPRPVDLVASSFPCIDLSLAGKRGGLAGDHSGAFWAFVEVLEELRDSGDAPRAVMIENVTGFLTSNGGEDFRVALRTLNGLGYRVDTVQVRRRAVHAAEQTEDLRTRAPRRRRRRRDDPAGGGSARGVGPRRERRRGHASEARPEDDVGGLRRSRPGGAARRPWGG